MAKKTADVLAPAQAPEAGEKKHNLDDLINFLSDAKGNGTLKYIKCSWSQGGDGGEAYTVKIPSASEMERIKAMLQDQNGVATPAPAASTTTEAAPEKQAVSAPESAPVVTQSSKKNVVKASKATAAHLRGYYPKEFLKRMGLA